MGAAGNPRVFRSGFAVCIAFAFRTGKSRFAGILITFLFVFVFVCIEDRHM